MPGMTRGPDHGPRKTVSYKRLLDHARKKIDTLQKAIESIEEIIRGLREKGLIEPAENQATASEGE